MKKLLCIMIGLPIALVCSCEGVRTGNSDVFIKVNKTTAYEDFTKTYSKYIDTVCETSVAGNNYKLVFTNAETSRHVSVYGNGYSVTSIKEITLTSFIFVFSREKFVYSGYVYEMFSQSDPVIQSIGAELQNELEMEDLRK